MQNYDAIVIGAGHNGLIAAGYLARAGQRVLVLERREIVGGACVTEEVWPGYRVSTAAYLCSLLLPEIVADLELARYGFEVYRRETAGFAPFADERSLFLFADAEKTRAALTDFCRDTPEDVAAFFHFEADIERAAEVVEKWTTGTPPDEARMRRDFAEAGHAQWYAEFVAGSVRDLLDSRFRNPQLKALLATDGLIGTYGGPSTPGTAYVLLHHYLGKILGARGAWGYVRGGMGQITQALAHSLTDSGGEIRTNAPVAKIVIKNGRAVGVTLESGETIYADVILSNADPHRTFVTLLGEDSPVKNQPGLWQDLTTRGGASCKINLAVSELPRYDCLPASASIQNPNSKIQNGAGLEHLGTTHLCRNMDALDRAFEEAANGFPATEPMIEIYVQTATDSRLTPPGKHILSLFTQYFPYHLAPGLDLDAEREKYADRVIALVGRFAPNVPASILHRQVLTPRDLEARFGLTGGHIFHGDLLPPRLFNGRPGVGFCGPQTPVPGLLLCGSGASPGGCVYGAPGRNAALLLLSRKSA